MGFGNVGSHVAKFIKAKFPHYFRIIAVSDVNGGVFNEEGLNINELIERMNATGSIINAPNTRPITNDELLELDCDILIPAALENVITSDNADRIKAKIILEGANGPTTPEADEILKSRNILVIPDILANAGGVTVSFFEWARNVSIRDERIPAPQTEEVLKRLNEIMVASTDGVIETAESYNTDLRNAAYITAIKRAAPLFRTKHLAE
jgi:glutamate dehydrogenase (NAD(P)+)